MANNKQKKICKIIQILILCVMILTTTITYVGAQTLPKIKSQSSMVVDNINGQILYDYDEDVAVEVGEVSKSLTLYTVMLAVEQGKITLKDNVPISDAAYALSQDYDLANVPLRQDFQYTVEELMEVVAINGANGATLALAEYAGGGSEEKFVQQMKDQLNKWDIQDYQIYNSTGLPTELVPLNSSTYQQGSVNKLTAKACALATYHLLQLNPKLTEYSAQTDKVFKEDTDDPYEIPSYNKILPGQSKEYKGATGFLLGSSKNDGDSAIFTVTRSNLPVIAVVLGSGKGSQDINYSDGHKVLDYVFATYVIEQVVQSGDKVSQIAQIKVSEGVKTVAKLDYLEDLYLVLPIIDTAPQLTYEYQPDTSFYTKDGKIKAPIKEGTPVGVVVVDTKEKTSKFLPGAKENKVLVGMQESVDKANWLQKTWQGTTQFVGDSLESTRQFFTNLFN